jgi:arylsulfatase A-like enzyme
VEPLLDDSARSTEPTQTGETGLPDSGTPNSTTQETGGTDSTTQETGPPGTTFQETPLEFDGDRPQNVLIVTIDTLRRDAMAVHGGGESEFFDNLASQSLVLDQHRSCSAWTLPSLHCLLSGRGNLAAGFAPSAAEDAVVMAPDDSVMLAERLASAGYATALVNTTRWMSPGFGLDQGYQVAFDQEGASIEDHSQAILSSATELVAGAEPWLLHVHLCDPHAPYSPPVEYLEGIDLQPIAYSPAEMPDHSSASNAYVLADITHKQLLARWFAAYYQGEVRYLGDQLGQIWQELEEMGALEDTLVVLASDHGEQLWDHGSLGHNTSLHHEENDAIVWFWAKNLIPGV